jgi:FKBP-type peptidyl-prolyl cis-trans isomerase
MKRWLIWTGLSIVALSVVGCGGGTAPTAPSAAHEGGNLITTASGLKYEDLVVGTGASPAPTDLVTVHYTGTLQDGTVFDASRNHGGPISFRLNQVIKGWTEGVGSMKVGGTRKLVIPPQLGYGSRAQGSIPANSTLTFIVELLDVPQVKIEDTQAGAGAEAAPGKTVSVHYTGRLESGQVFDSSVGGDPLTFTLGAGGMIPGFEQGVTGMKVGGKRTITIPPSLGYGEQGRGDVIPPNSTLIFDLELVEVK